MEARKTDSTKKRKREDQREEAYLLCLPNETKRRVRRKDLEDPQIPSRLLDLPIEMLDAIRAQILAQEPVKEAARSLSSLSGACSSLNGLFQHAVDKIRASVTKLGQHVVDGEEKEAKAMLEKNPGLLLTEVEVTNKACQRIKGTAYKFALGAGDSAMRRMIEPFFAKLEKGDEEKTKQTNEQFPASYDVNAYEKYDFKALVDVIAADPLINYQDDQMNEVTREVLQAYEEHFTPKPTDVITTGKHFDMRIFLDALTAYDENFNRLNWAQRSSYCRKALGILQRLFPACDAQAYCHGFYNVGGELLDRSLKLNNGTDFYSSGLGGSYFVYVRGVVCAGWGREGGEWMPGVRYFAMLEKLCQSKATALAELTQREQHPVHHEKPMKSRCVVS